MSNTISSSLFVDSLADKTLSVLGNRFASLKSFAQDFSATPGERLQSVQVPVYASGSALLVNPSDFSAGDSTLNSTKVTLNYYSLPFGFSHIDENKGFDAVAHLAEGKIKDFANGIMAIALAPVTTGNFGAPVITSATNFSSSGINTLWASIAKGSTKSLILNPTLFASLNPTSTIGFNMPQGAAAYNYDAIYYNTSFTGAGANIQGFAASPEALAMAARIPDVSSLNGLVEQQVVTVPDLGLPIAITSTVDVIKRVKTYSLDVLFGVAAADTTALKIIAY